MQEPFASTAQVSTVRARSFVTLTPTLGGRQTSQLPKSCLSRSSSFFDGWMGTPVSAYVSSARFMISWSRATSGRAVLWVFLETAANTKVVDVDASPRFRGGRAGTIDYLFFRVEDVVPEEHVPVYFLSYHDAVEITHKHS